MDMVRIMVQWNMGIDVIETSVYIFVWSCLKQETPSFSSFPLFHPKDRRNNNNGGLGINNNDHSHGLSIT